MVKISQASEEEIPAQIRLAKNYVDERGNVSLKCKGHHLEQFL